MDNRKKKCIIISCSNPVPEERRPVILRTEAILSEAGYEVEESGSLYAGIGMEASFEPKRRAEALMKAFRDPEGADIFDVSGGDLSNTILPFLDYGIVKESRARFWGYSDLTALINAIYAMTGKPSMLYHVPNLAVDEGRRHDFTRYIRGEDDSLIRPSFELVQGEGMDGAVIGGNIRCFLKLAGTPYWPDVRGKLLLLEAMSGKTGRIASYLAQLSQLSVFEKAGGILLGTFLELEKEMDTKELIRLLKEYAGEKIPVAVTREIGHRTDSKAIMIGIRISIGKT